MAEELKTIRLAKSSIGSEEIELVTKVLKEEYLGMGKYVQMFEKELENYFRRRVVAVNTGTAALHLSYQAIGLREGDEVLVQSLTYLATFQAIHATGAIAIPCEVNKNTFTIDLNDAKKKITGRTKAITPVHYSGNPGNLDDIYNFANDHNLRVVEDAAHAFGSTYKERLIGSFGDICCFSFDGIKNITSGEGGAIVSNDELFMERIKNLRLLAVNKDTVKRYNGARSWDPEVEEQGWRYHMSNIMAAIGIEQLRKFPERKEYKKKLVDLYYSRLRENPKIVLLEADYNEVVPHLFVIRVNERDFVREVLQNYGIQTGIHYKPNHLLEYFKRFNSQKLPVTEEIYSEIMSIPLHYDLSTEEVCFICEKILYLVK